MYFKLYGSKKIKNQTIKLKNKKQKYRLISIFVAIAILFFNINSIQIVFGSPDIPEFEIPIEPVLQEDSELSDIDQNAEDDNTRTIDYTENLWDVTDIGIFDGEGEFYGETSLDTLDQEVTEEVVEEASVDTAFEEYRQGIIDSRGGKKAFAKERLRGIKENLSEQMIRFSELNQEIEYAEKKLSPLKEETTTLQNQIKVLNTQIQIAKKKITNTEVFIAGKQIEIKDLMLNLKKSEIEIEIQKKIVLDYVKLLYQQENQFFDLYSEGSSTVKLLLADSSVSENILGQEYLKIMGETGREVFYNLEIKNRELIERQHDIQDEQKELEFLYSELLKEKHNLEETRLSKKDILEETQGKEEKYQALLDQAIQEQLATSIAVQNLQENVELIESKLDALDDGLNIVEDAEEGDLELLEDAEDKIEFKDSVEGVADELDASEESKFSWPVPPNKITAEFHDPSYPKKWGLHNAIDIRAKQSTEILAPANGYVYQTKDNGMGYSYIILAHKGNFVTVYGHVSEIIAKPGTVVKKGEVIGLSGGTPGTKGAGLQTTGPHLHFEVHYKGEPVNPLKYLPLEEMPLEYVPDEFLLGLK